MMKSGTLVLGGLEVERTSQNLTAHVKAARLYRGVATNSTERFDDSVEVTYLERLQNWLNVEPQLKFQRVDTILANRNKRRLASIPLLQDNEPTMLGAVVHTMDIGSKLRRLVPFGRRK